MSKVNFNQLKKSVFTMKNYIDNNMKNGYIAKYTGNFEISIDSEGNISNNDNPTSQYKRSNGQNYLTWEVENLPITSENLVRASISIDGNNYCTDMSIIGASTAKSYASTLKMLSGNNLTFQLIFRFNTKYTYSEDGTVNNETKQDTQSMILMFYSKDENLVNKTINVKYTIYSYNENSFMQFPSLKSTSLYSITQADNENETGVGSINLSSGSSPDYTFIISGLNGHNEFISNCYYGQIIGYLNKLNKFNFYNILGRYNNISGKANSSYYENYISIIGDYNTYTADSSAVNYKPVSIIGNNLNVVNSGLYIGMGGTFLKDDIMGIAEGTATKENIIFRVKRDGRVKASTPTEDNDLTTKKYVDDKIAGIVDSAPETLDTLKELSTALGDDPNFATTVATNIGNKVDKVDGKGLSTNDLTDELKTNYDAAYAYSQATHSYNDLTDKPEIPSTEGLATEEYVDNKLLSINMYLSEDITSSTPTVTYKNDYSAYSFDKIGELADIINGLELEITTTPYNFTYVFKDFVYDSNVEAYSSYLNYNGSVDTEDIVYITNNNDKTFIIYSSEINNAGAWSHVKVYRNEDKYANKTDIHTHSNKEVLDTITAEKVAQWDNNTDSGGGTASGINIVTISQSDYDALETKDANTLYLITTTNAGTVDTTSNDIILSDDLPAGTYTLKYEDENNQPLDGFDEITTMEVQ